jgi:predicted DNA-binding transcriptional regulator AlpA
MIDLLTESDLAERFGCSVFTVRRLRDRGRLPEPVRISDRIVRWPADSIDRWIGDGCPPVEMQCDLAAGEISAH